MRVRVVLTVDVDLAAWGELYGLDDPASVRQDVRDYARGQLTLSAAAEEGAIRNVT